jgi:hypothetical protein
MNTIQPESLIAPAHYLQFDGPNDPGEHVHQHPSAHRFSCEGRGVAEVVTQRQAHDRFHFALRELPEPAISTRPHVPNHRSITSPGEVPLRDHLNRRRVRSDLLRGKAVALVVPVKSHPTDSDGMAASEGTSGARQT